MKKRLLLIAAALVLTVSSAAGCSSLKADEVAVSVDDSELTADVANFYARYMQAQYETYYGAYLGDNMWSTEAEEGKTYEESVKSSIQDELKRMLVIEKHMADYDIELTDAEKKAIKDTAKEFDESNSLENKEKILCSTEAVERFLTLTAIEGKMSAAIQDEENPKITDKEAAQKSMEYVLFSYQPESNAGDDSEDSTDSSDDSDSSETKELTDAEKKEIKKKAEKFAADAKASSEDSIKDLAKEAGLEASTATFDKDSQTPDADLIKAADKLDENGVTDVVETDNGCYVAKVTSLMDKDATEAKKAEMIQEAKSEHFTEVVDKWLDDAKVSVNKDVWDKISFNDISVTMKQEKQDPYSDEVKTDDEAQDEDAHDHDEAQESEAEE